MLMSIIVKRISSNWNYCKNSFNFRLQNLIQTVWKVKSQVLNKVLNKLMLKLNKKKLKRRLKQRNTKIKYKNKIRQQSRFKKIGEVIWLEKKRH